MLKRTIPLLIAVAFVLVAATPAQAGDCARCRFSIDMQWCQYNTSIGGEDCEFDLQGNCRTVGECNPSLTASAVTPLAAEYEVASVERIDEAPGPGEALVAQLDAPQPAAKSAH